MTGDRDMRYADGFRYVDGRLCAGTIPLDDIARETGTPCFVYSLDALTSRFRIWEEAFAPLPHRTCYAVKANSSLAVLQTLSRAGAGFDVNSGGELFRALRAGADPSRVTMTGVGKSPADIRDGLAAGILLFNAESIEECRLIDAIAGELGRDAHIVLRINPNVDAQTHPYIATGLAEHKFGLNEEDARAVLPEILALRHVRLKGFGMHLGSQIFDAEPYIEGLATLLRFLRDTTDAHDAQASYVNIGGGVGVPYREDDPVFGPEELVQAILPVLRDHAGRAPADPPLTILSEPGRWLVANTGVLLSRVASVKRTSVRTFVILDAGMNDLIRPALYDAHHEIHPLRCIPGAHREPVDIVGPVCESGDTFAVDRTAEIPIEGGLVAIFSAGAYGAVMSSTYNSRPLAPEVCVRGRAWVCTRERQTFDQMIQNERLFP